MSNIREKAKDGAQSLFKFIKLLKPIDNDALTQFVVTLRSELDVLVASSDAVKNSPLVDEIKDILRQIESNTNLNHNWNKAYHAEKLLLPLYSDERVQIELNRRLNISEINKTEFRQYYETEVKEIASQETDSIAKRRELLYALVGDMQWFYNRRHLKMRYARVAIYKVGTVFCVAFAFFMGVLMIGHWQ